MTGFPLLIDTAACQTEAVLPEVPAMREAEWLACGDPRRMVAFLRRRGGERKRRLFAAACCRRVWHLLTDERSRAAVEAAERFADGRATEEELLDAEEGALEAEMALRGDTAAPAGASHAAEAAYVVACHGVGWDIAEQAAGRARAAALRADGGGPDEEDVQVALIRDIFGNPFRRPKLLPGWRTPTVLALAVDLYESRFADLQALLILADALEDAGCADADILAHLRGPGPHVRGCWALDLILGKE
jgi:hypothetical protein